jgi:hypothetical protein
MKRILWTASVAIGVIFLAFMVSMNFFKGVSAPNGALKTVAQAPQIISNPALLERAIVRKAKQDRWWMIFVGATILVYQLLRKHQALFGSSVVYASSEGFAGYTQGNIATLEADFDSLPETVADVS